MVVRQSTLLKADEVKEIKDILSKYDTVAIASLEKVRSAQLQKLRQKLQKDAHMRVIKNSLILKDVKISSYTYIKGANKLKNLTINSSEEEPTQIGEGVELVNGIIGYGCHIFYGWMWRGRGRRR